MTDLEPGPVQVVRSRILGRVPHGFLGRRGGVSTGELAGLNTGIGSGDDPALVEANRQRAAAAVLPGAPLVGLYQIHSAQVVQVTVPWNDGDRPKADAMVTDHPGVLLGIVTADCAPVLLADAQAGVIGAAHAGWKGAIGGVLEATVEAMTALGAEPRRISAAIGPCIAQESYEVDDAFRARFLAEDGAYEQFFAEGKPGHWYFDLREFAVERLSVAHVGAVSRFRLDTYALDHQFYSYRRATHRGEPAYGRQISLIALNNAA